MQSNKVMLGVLALIVTGVAGFAAGKSASQEAPVTQAGNEHEWLASLAGEYNAKVGGMMGESDGTSHVQSSLGGLWNIARFEGTIMGQPFSGIEILGFDPLKKKYVSVWVDSMTPLLVTTEGAYDADTKTLTMRGISRGMDGEEAEMVNTTEFRDDGMLFTMSIAGAPLMTIDYSRKE